MTLPFMPAAAYGGAFRAGQPTLIVIHSAESEITAGIAESLAGPGWFGGPKAGTSAHSIFDADSGVEMVRASTIAYHCGAKGNVVGIGVEHAGRARFTRAQWLTPAGERMLRASAKWTAAKAKALGIPPRWLTLTQLARGERGFCTHNDVRLALGGTTHSDPGAGFPYDLYMQWVLEAMGTATFSVAGAFLEGWTRFGQARAGRPTSAEAPTRDGLGRVQSFERAIALWHMERTGKKAVFIAVPGALFDYWRGRGGEDPANPSSIGYPVADEAVWLDGQAVGQAFERSLVVWHPKHGARGMTGRILEAWGGWGAERGVGYPVSEEFDVDGGRAQDFERGRLVHRFDDRVVVLARQFT